MKKADLYTDNFEMPCNKEAEAELLGGLLIQGDLIWETGAVLKPEDFYIGSHRKIFSAIVAVAESNLPIEPILVQERLREWGDLEAVGGGAYIGELISFMYRPSSVDSYIRLIKEAAIRRRFIANSRKGLTAILDGEDLDSVLSDSRTFIDDALDREQKKEISVLQIAQECLERAEELAASGKTISGIPTGFIDLDKLTSGLQPANLSIVAARPSVGKTSLASNIAEYAAGKGYSVGVASLEMTKHEFIGRMMCSMAQVNYKFFRSGTTNPKEWSRVTVAQQILTDMTKQIQIADNTEIETPLQLKARAKRWKAAQGLDLLIVDYLTLMNGDGKYDSKEKEYADIALRLKRLASELQTHVLAVAQLNRKIEDRTDKEPKLSDLRESGAIEQHADVILFIAREHIFDEKDPEAVNRASLTLAKQRNGPTGKFNLTYFPEWTRFENAARV